MFQEYQCLRNGSETKGSGQLLADYGNAFWRVVKVFANEKNVSVCATTSMITVVVNDGAPDREIYRFTPSFTRDSWGKFTALLQKFRQELARKPPLDDRNRARMCVILGLETRGFPPKNAVRIADRMKNPQEHTFWEEHRPNPQFSL